MADSIRLKVKGWKNLDEAFQELEEEVTQVVRGLTVMVWDSILVKTPQFYGGMAASWTYTYSPSNFKDRSASVRPEEKAADSLWATDYYSVKRRGHTAAIKIANQASAGKDDEFRLGRKVYITNGVDHGEGPYSGKVEDGEVVLRAVNRPGAPVSRTLAMIESRFGTDISRPYALKLMNMKIGGQGATGDS